MDRQARRRQGGEKVGAAPSCRASCTRQGGRSAPRPRPRAGLRSQGRAAAPLEHGGMCRSQDGGAGSRLAGGGVWRMQHQRCRQRRRQQQRLGLCSVLGGRGVAEGLPVAGPFSRPSKGVRHVCPLGTAGCGHGADRTHHASYDVAGPQEGPRTRDLLLSMPGCACLLALQAWQRCRNTVARPTAPAPHPAHTHPSRATPSTPRRTSSRSCRSAPSC